MSDKKAKFDDVQINNGALKEIGKQIAERLKKAKQYEDLAVEKAGVELKKAQDYRDSIAQLLAEAKQQCRGQGFKAFKEKYCPDLGKSRIYELLAIGEGRKTPEEVRSATRERTAKARADKSSATGDVADTTVSLGTGHLIEPTIEEELGTVTSQNALTEFEKACDQWLPLMDEDERKKARVYHNTWKERPQRKAKAA